MKCKAYFIGVKAISLGHDNEKLALLNSAVRTPTGIPQGERI